MCGVAFGEWRLVDEQDFSFDNKVIIVAIKSFLLNKIYSGLHVQC